MSPSCQLNIPSTRDSWGLFSTLREICIFFPLLPPLAPRWSLGTGFSSAAGREESLDRHFFIPPVRAATEARASRPAGNVSVALGCTLAYLLILSELGNFFFPADVTPEHRAWMNSGIFHMRFFPPLLLSRPIHMSLREFGMQTNVIIASQN